MLGAEVEANIDITADDVLEAHRDRLKKAGELGFAVSQEEVPVDTGGLKQSGFGPEMRDRGGSVVIGYTARHAAPMEFGTDPGHYPPVQPLVRWAERIGKDAGFGYYVARHVIPSEGVAAQPYLSPAADRMQKWLDTHGLEL
jgi:hypothetical protein